MKSRLWLLRVVVLCTAAFPGVAQDCEENLRQAQAALERGHFNTIPELLKTCIDRGTRDQRFRANLLLTQVYLFIDDPIGAERSYIEVLKADPEFIPGDTAYPIDVVYLSRRFTSNPIFTIYPKVGMNTSFVRVIHDLGTNDTNLSDDTYGLKLGWQIGFGFDLNITEHFSFCGELMYARRSFEKSLGMFFYDSSLKKPPSVPSGDEPADPVSLVEKHQWVDLPFYVKYADYRGDFRPYGYAGFAIGWLAGAKTEDRLEDFDYDDKVSTVKVEGPDLNVGRQREGLGYSVVLGGGVRRKIGRDYVSVDIRYMVGINNLVPPDKIYSEATETIFRYAEVSDLYALNNLSVSFGYIRPLYAPRLKPTTRTFFRDLFKKGGSGGK
jgi:hypothetical protein